MTSTKKIVVLISGNGSNLQALADGLRHSDHPAEIAAVISNKPEAFGLQRARDAGIDALCLNHKEYANRAEFDQALSRMIDDYQPDLVVLAGFMRILTTGFVEHYYGRMLNIHPSLLPRYQGLHTHQRALTANDKIHGATVHFVTEELDGGPSVLQAEVPVLTGDTAENLAARVLVQEHAIYPEVVRWFCAGRLLLKNGVSWLDNHPLPPGGIRISNATVTENV